MFTNSGYGGFSDNKYGGSNMNSMNSIEVTKRIRMIDIEKFRACDLPERGIKKETLEHFGVKVELSPSDGVTPVAIYFPYYDQRNKLSGYKRRDFMVDKNDRGHFTAVGKVSVDCKLFGQKQAENAVGKKKNIHYQEGEFDVLSSYQAVIDSLPEKWVGKIEPRIVGLPCGTGNAVEATVHNEAFFDGAEKIVLGFDNDFSSPVEKDKGIKRGVEATEDVAGILMKGNLFTVTYADGNKDPSDYLQAGMGKELSKLLAFDMERFVADKVVSAEAVGFEECISQKPAGVYVDSFPDLMSKIKGVRKRELVVLTSLSGVGKSTYVSEISYHLAKEAKVGMIFLEEETKETVQRMMARDLTVNYNNFKFDPQAYASNDQLRASYDWVVGEETVITDNGEEETTNRFVFLDHFGSMKVEELMNKIKYLTHVCKCDYIMLDHLTLVVSGGGASTNQTAELDTVMAELAGFCASNDVGVFAISHLNRSAADEIRGISELTEPKWICVKKEDMRGSSSLEALSWIVLGIDLEIMPDRTRGRTRITVLKNRPFGLLGECDVLNMDSVTGLLEDRSDLSMAGH